VFEFEGESVSTMKVIETFLFLKIFSYSRRGSQNNFTAQQQSREGRGEHRRGGGYANPLTRCS
jgi:hypothetical protein